MRFYGRGRKSMPAALSRPTADLLLPSDRVMIVPQHCYLDYLCIFLPSASIASYVFGCLWTCSLLCLHPNRTMGCRQISFICRCRYRRVWCLRPATLKIANLSNSVAHFQLDRKVAVAEVLPLSGQGYTVSSTSSTPNPAFALSLKDLHMGKELSQDQRQATIDCLSPFASLFPDYRRQIYTAHSSSHWQWKFQTHHFISASCFGRREWCNQWTHWWHALEGIIQESNSPEFLGSLCHQGRWLSSCLCWLQETERCYYTRWLPTSENGRHCALSWLVEILYHSEPYFQLLANRAIQWQPPTLSLHIKERTLWRIRSNAFWSLQCTSHHAMFDGFGSCWSNVAGLSGLSGRHYHFSPTFDQHLVDPFASLSILAKQTSLSTSRNV